jgi:glycosyltransferase involved in cell wall biosynthesis
MNTGATKSQMHILMGVVPNVLTGGVPAGTDDVTSCLESFDDVVVKRFRYGRRREHESTISKTTRTLIDLVHVVVMLLVRRPDIVHLHSGFNRNGILRDFMYVILFKSFKLPTVFFYHGSDPIKVAGSRFLNSLGKILIAKADLVGFLSEEEILMVKKRYPKGRYYRFKLATNVNKRIKNLDSLRVSSSQLTILFIARFVEKKGPLDVLRAFSLLGVKYEYVRLVMVGNGTVWNDCRRLAEELSIGHKTEFVGQVSEDEARKYYASSQIMVLPTYFAEGFPMAILFSLIDGLAIITTRIRGAADYLSEPANCLWVEAKKPEMLADRMRRLIDDEPLRAKMGEANKKLATVFDASLVAAEQLSMYKTLLADCESKN